METYPGTALTLEEVCIGEDDADEVEEGGVGGS